MNIQTPNSFKEALLAKEEERKLRKRKALEGLLTLSNSYHGKSSAKEILDLIKEGRR